ncbi:hypothetical protein A2U01_0098750 [Trifolium medium]|nr:hypothetical protein [Trifolium medium]
MNLSICGVRHAPSMATLICVYSAVSPGLMGVDEFLGCKGESATAMGVRRKYEAVEDVSISPFICKPYLKSK